MQYQASWWPFMDFLRGARVFEGGVDVVDPQVWRLGDVDVAVHDLEAVVHAQTPKNTKPMGLQVVDPGNGTAKDVSAVCIGEEGAVGARYWSKHWR